MAATAVQRNELPDPFHGWRDYPINLAAYDPITTSGPVLKKRIRDLSKGLFEDNTKVRLIDLEEEKGRLGCSHKTFDNAESLKLALSQSRNPRTRIISIHQRNSQSCFQITEELMLQILTRYQVVPDFLEVLFSFGASPHVAESGNANIAVVDAIDGVQHTCYQLRYVEENYRAAYHPWSIRQTGVYHQHSHNFDFWIILNPKKESIVEKQLEGLEKPFHSAALRRIIEDPRRLHVLIFEASVHNWRWYLRFLGEKFEQRNDPAFVFDLKDAKSGVLSFDAVRELRDLHDYVIALSAHCNGDLKVIDTLRSLNSNNKKRHILTSYSDLLQGYNESLAVLQNRIQNVIDLTTYALDTKSQEEAAALNKHILNLTDESSKDNATVKLITILSLLYLPGSFVGTVFGTNFFWYNNKTNRIRIGKDFWIYVVTWISLTAITLSVYLYLRWQQKNSSKVTRRTTIDSRAS